MVARRAVLVLRAIFLVVFLLLALWGVFLSGWWPHDLGEVRTRLAGLGPGAYTATILLHALAVVLLVPGFLLILATAYLFGLSSIWISLIGQTLGAMAAWFIARHGAHDLLVALLGARLVALRRALEGSSFRTLLLLRLVSLLPGPIIVYAPGILRLPFRDVFFAAVLGQLPLVLVLGYFGTSLRTVNHPRELLTPQFVLALVILVAFLALPVFVASALRSARRSRHRPL